MTNVEQEKHVTLNIKDHIAFVYFNREKKHNALNLAMFYQIKQTIKSLKNNKDIRAVIVTGHGEDFCTGLDVKSVMKSATAPLKLLMKWHPWQANLAQIVSTGWQEIAVPVIMVIEGRCWGGGLQIALGGDFRITTPNASLSVMEARWGLIPDMGGTIPLQRLVKQDVAKELAMTGKIIDGLTAHELGLISHVSETPMIKAIELAETICQQSPDSVAATKKLYNNSWFGNTGWALFKESYYQLKILLGKNSKIKAYNQTHDKEQAKAFITRKKW